MKKDAKLNSKLCLNRETLRALEQRELETVAGGATIPCSDLGSCVGCNTRNTCTSRYC